MKYFADIKAQQELPQIINIAQHEPVVIQHQERDVAIILSMDEYEQLRTAQIEDFQTFCDLVGQEAQAKGLTAEKLQDILSEDE